MPRLATVEAWSPASAPQDSLPPPPPPAPAPDPPPPPPPRPATAATNTTRHHGHGRRRRRRHRHGGHHGHHRRHHHDRRRRRRHRLRSRSLVSSSSASSSSSFSASTPSSDSCFHTNSLFIFGRKGSLVVSADRFTKKETDDATGDETELEIPFLKAYTLFNVEQIVGLPAIYYAKAASSLNPAARIARAEKFFATTGASI